MEWELAANAQPTNFKSKLNQMEIIQASRRQGKLQIATNYSNSWIIIQVTQAI